MDNRYDRDPEPHINLICTACGKIEDFKRGFPVPPGEVKEKAGFDVKEVRMEYYGKCAGCATRI
jgi:Fe2+ or Zn2+ uptake regulation protein